MKIENNYTNYELEKISPRTDQPAVEPGGESPSQSKSKSSQGTEGSARDAIVNLSQASKEALLIEKTISNTPDIRQDKVLALKEKIMNGQYKVDAQAIAEKMVDHFAEDVLPL